MEDARQEDMEDRKDIEGVVDMEDRRDMEDIDDTRHGVCGGHRKRGGHGG